MSPLLEFPPPLRPGDLLATVAPSSPFDRALALRGLAWLGERYRVAHLPSVFARDAYLAGDDERRADELNWALASGARAVVGMRGGYGTSRIVDRLDWTAFRARPCWIIGFSDLTSLHLAAHRNGVASIHGAMVCELGRGNAHARARWIDCVEAPRARRSWTGLSRWHAGAATGILFGGNLTLLHSSAAAGRLSVPYGAVLLVEDVGERPYRVDRMLSDLASAGHLDRVAAVLVGDFTQCPAGRDGRDVYSVLRERFTRLGVPVVARLPIGHDRRNDPVVLGARAHVDASAGTLTLEADPTTS